MSKLGRMTRYGFQSLVWYRLGIVVILLLQLFIIVDAILSNSRSSQLLQAVLSLISVFAALHAMARADKGAYKLSWVFLVLLAPLFGGVFYWLFNAQLSTRGLQKKLDEIEKKSKYAFLLAPDSYDKACAAAPAHQAEIRYLQKFNGFPIYQNTQTHYCSTGEESFARMLQEMERAERYIFMEYFIIAEGEMWDEILSLLRRKVEQGVDVRVIYDDLGCFFLLPKDYRQQLEEVGVKAQVFNPFRPFLTTVQNNRDHRKILSIDGKIAFTGGLNLADEYINRKERFGHWKDGSIVIEGHAAWSFTLMFLEMWSLLAKIEERYEDYLPPREELAWIAHDGFVQPYSDSPMDEENVSEHVCLRLIEKAQKQLYITTPYLVPEDGVVSALRLAAKSGVDVRIITPHIPDKKLVQFVGRSYYRSLIAAGVRIYEYEKGFIHTKNFVADDQVASVGTVNLDFRSFYLHFECGTLLYGSKAVAEVKQDFLSLLPSCIEVQEEDCRANRLVRFLQDILRIFAPLI